MTYRKDIQMLRGVAVLLVVLFHLGLPGFRSGFLGVDVFFVISGYLMAVMYSPNEIRPFYSRRVRRLLPAYFVAIVATALGSLLIAVPTDFNQVAVQSWFASFLFQTLAFG